MRDFVDWTVCFKLSNGRGVCPPVNAKPVAGVVSGIGKIDALAKRSYGPVFADLSPLVLALRLHRSVFEPVYRAQIWPQSSNAPNTLLKLTI